MVPARFGGVLAALSILLFSTPDAGAVPQDDLRQELARLAQRVDRLEAENEALKARNDRLELAVAELQLPTRQAPPTLAAATPAAPLPEPKPAPKSWYESVKVSGYLFGDAYAVLENHDPDVQDQYGFWVRRAYLTVDSKLDEEWSARLRFEVNSPGDFETNSKLEPFVKDAYLAWKRDGRELYLGLSPSPTFDYIEGFWGLRHIEKTPLDLYRMASSRDLGIAYKGKARDGAVFYHAMLGNGAGDGAETNKGKKITGSLGLRPTDSLVTQVYADYEDRPGETDRSTLQAFLGFEGEQSRYGLQYAWQRREVENAADEDIAILSAFGAWQLTHQGLLFARYDRSFDGIPDAARIPYLDLVDDMRFDLAILGWEHRLMPRVRLAPNLEYVHYRATDGVPAPDDDLFARLTLFYEF